MLPMTSNTKYSLPYVRQSLIILESRKFLASGIRNPRLWNPESHQRSGSTHKDCNRVPGIRNPWRGMRNPSLSWIPLLVATVQSISPRRTDVYCEGTTCNKLCRRPVSVILHKRLCLTLSPNNVFLLHALKILFKLSSVLLDIEKYILRRGAWGFTVLWYWAFFMRYFGNVNCNVRYCGIIYLCGMRFFITLADGRT